MYRYPKAVPLPYGAVLVHNLHRRHAPVTHNLLRFLSTVSCRSGIRSMILTILHLLLRYRAAAPHPHNPIHASIIGRNTPAQETDQQRVSTRGQSAASGTSSTGSGMREEAWSQRGHHGTGKPAQTHHHRHHLRRSNPKLFGKFLQEKVEEILALT